MARIVMVGMFALPAQPAAATTGVPIAHVGYSIYQKVKEDVRNATLQAGHRTDRMGVYVLKGVDETATPADINLAIANDPAAKNFVVACSQNYWLELIG